ncbi:18.1 kDa class I heat shock protein-like [Rhodamnia argentea]|uniref:18.1 kDa class I heat shock protein-like n=1 Tax=Rhodamnia argentea TaxID=178133 RepID=A0A8B8NPF7_9MYRT|nr:18.1 kDa class I heat shock protein-like [Rhodamnia argentea]
MSFIPSWYGGRRSDAFDHYAFDPCAFDLWYPFQGFPFPSSSLSASSFPQAFWEDPASVDTRIDWRETPEAYVSSFPQTFWENSAFGIGDTKIDWRETPEAHVMKADLSGLKKEEVKVRIEDERVLQICGERKVERGSGKFMRSFRLPENARVDQVKASMEKGVLTVIIPKV